MVSFGSFFSGSSSVGVWARGMWWVWHGSRTASVCVGGAVTYAARTEGTQRGLPVRFQPGHDAPTTTARPRARRQGLKQRQDERTTRHSPAILHGSARVASSHSGNTVAGPVGRAMWWSLTAFRAAQEDSSDSGGAPMQSQTRRTGVAGRGKVGSNIHRRANEGGCRSANAA